MLKSEMQHQFWITKKNVQRKFGSKEDEHIISSDADLDAKIDVFKSISTTSIELSKIIVQFQERICVLSQEECLFGRFLKEAGKRSKTTGKTITNTGKAVSYCGQQRMCIRVPLLRLQHEVDVFRGRAITDMQNTITVLEKERTEYRAALEWMKSASIELDPDTGRGLDKFRTAQSHVRNAKQHFDSLTMDSIQKIDLLAAARCNMFSHVLVSYMSELKQFAQKTNTTFEAISKVVEHKPKYDFCILKELTQHEGNHGNVNDYKASTFDRDQSLFFAEDYVDNTESNVRENKQKKSPTKLPDDNLLKICNKTDYIIDLNEKNQNESARENKESEAVDVKSAEMLSKTLNTEEVASLKPIPILPANARQLTEMKSKRFESSHVAANDKINSKHIKPNPWMELFADLDPLANLEAFDLKLSGACKNIQQT